MGLTKRERSALLDLIGSTVVHRSGHWWR